MYATLQLFAGISLPAWLSIHSGFSSTEKEKPVIPIKDDEKVVKWYIKPGNNWVYQSGNGDCYLLINISSTKGLAAPSKTLPDRSFVTGNVQVLQAEKQHKSIASVVAQHATVDVTIPPGLTCVKVYGSPYEVTEGSVLMRLNNLYADYARSLLVHLKSKGSFTSNLRIDCTLEYTDTATSERVKEGRPVQLLLTTDKDLIRSGEAPDVQAMLALLASTPYFDTISQGGYEG
ncbi:hypothetical protein [Chitinophaga rhizophila]|uniref:Uncharacterized protein n=1 Tax=Chitinophaga rhizophila TaxID=2866212 RepID=A0ABS7GL37_9BACT|nr:hypothetical protein [Chitinophaga rhizophila]MBW8688021.1 hypothetical protein [Chitinophaga rhizophila]